MVTSLIGRLPKADAPEVGVEQADVEHRVQMGLIRASRKALENGDAESLELLNQLQEYTEMHFLSEQLLLRMAARSNYEAHVAEHQRLLEDVAGVQALLDQGEITAASTRLSDHEQHVLDHIRSWDRSV